jgi:hypothetical protein
MRPCDARTGSQPGKRCSIISSSMVGSVFIQSNRFWKGMRRFITVSTHIAMATGWARSKAPFEPRSKDHSKKDLTCQGRSIWWSRSYMEQEGVGRGPPCSVVSLSCETESSPTGPHRNCHTKLKSSQIRQGGQREHTPIFICRSQVKHNHTQLYRT